MFSQDNCRDVINKLKDNKGLILGISIFIWAWVLVFTLTFFKAQYAANATVLIKDSAITRRYVESEQYYMLPTTSSNAANPVLNTMGLLKSKAIMDNLYEFFKTKHPEELQKRGIETRADWEEFFKDGEHFIKAKNQPGTDLIAITFTWTDPEISQEGLEVVVKAFQHASLEVNQEEERSRQKYLKAQVGEMSTKLEKVREEKSRYKSQMKTVSVLREGDELATSRMALQTTLNQINSQARGKEAELHRYQKMLNLTPDKAVKASAIGMNSSMAKLQDQLYELNEQHAFLKATLTDKNPKVQEVKSRIAQIQQDIEKETQRTLGASPGEAGVAVADATRSSIVGDMVKAQSDAIRLNAEAAVVRQRLTQIDQDIKKFPEVEAGLASIEEKEKSLSLALDTLMNKELEAEMRTAQTLSNVFIIDPPRYPHEAKFPAPLHVILLGFIAGLATSVAVALFKDEVWEVKIQTSLPPVDLPMPQPVSKPSKIKRPQQKQEPLVNGTVQASLKPKSVMATTKHVSEKPEPLVATTGHISQKPIVKKPGQLFQSTALLLKQPTPVKRGSEASPATATTSRFQEASPSVRSAKNSTQPLQTEHSLVTEGKKREHQPASSGTPMSTQKNKTAQMAVSPTTSLATDGNKNNQLSLGKYIKNLNNSSYTFTAEIKNGNPGLPRQLAKLLIR